MGGGTYTPTKRRGPISAEFSSPGPAAVGLPSTFGANTASDSRKHRSPSYTMGARQDSKSEKIGPGPGQYNITGLSHKGKVTTLPMSLHEKPADPKGFITPAPGAYSPEKSGDVNHQETAPKYSFGIKTKIDTPPKTPAPNAYNIPTLLCKSNEATKHQAPCYSLAGKPKDAVDERVKFPGPGAYEGGKPDSYKHKSPVYSMGVRYELPSDHSKKPGPGVYSPEKNHSIGDAMIGRSFGIKHSPYTGELRGDRVVSPPVEMAYAGRHSTTVTSNKTEVTTQKVSAGVPTTKRDVKTTVTTEKVPGGTVRTVKTVETKSHTVKSR